MTPNLDMETFLQRITLTWARNMSRIVAFGTGSRYEIGWTWIVSCEGMRPRRLFILRIGLLRRYLKDFYFHVHRCAEKPERWQSKTRFIASKNLIHPNGIDGLFGSSISAS
jgi:hypothetical protein